MDGSNLAEATESHGGIPAPEPFEPADLDMQSAIAELSHKVRRQRLFLITALVAALAAGAGLVASTLVKSPAEEAAETKAPAATVLTAPVQWKVLRNVETMRGMVQAGGIITVTPAADSGAGSGTSLVVSRIYARAGDQIRNGQVLVEVSGRPILALAGVVPAYRDLKPGTDGDDVAQLQSALNQLGYPCTPDSPGHFGPATKTALTALYNHLGYSVPTTGGPGDSGDRTALQGAADAVTSAQRTAGSDKSALDKAKKALLEVQASNDGASSAAPSSSNTAAAPGTGTPALEAPSASAGSSPQAGESPLQAAQDAVSNAQTTYDYALADLAKARGAQAYLIATTGPMLPAAEVVYVPTFPIILSQLNAHLGSTVSNPLMTLASGALVVTSMLQPGQNTLIKPGMTVQLDAEGLGDQQAAGTVTAIGALSTGQQTSASQSGQSGGASAGVQSQAGGGAQAASQLPGYPMTVTPNSPLPSAWAGQDVRVVIASATTGGPVMSVPLSAVSTGADGQSTVTVFETNGSQRRVPITAGASADGDVEVTPMTAGSLKIGDEVVIGQTPQ